MTKQGKVLNYVLSQRQDLEMLLLPELVGNRTKDASANQLAFVVHDDYSVVIELDLAAVTAPFLHSSTDNHTVDHITFLDLATRLRFLHRTNYHVPEPRSFLPPQGLYAHDPLGSRVVYHLEVGSHLDECPDLLADSITVRWSCHSLSRRIDTPIQIVSDASHQRTPN